MNAGVLPEPFKFLRLDKFEEIHLSIYFSLQISE